MVRKLQPGVWAPIPTFMDDNEELGTSPDLSTNPDYLPVTGPWRLWSGLSRAAPPRDSGPVRCGALASVPRQEPQLTRTDIATFKQHIVSLAKGGMYPVVAGSMGEAFQLTDEERVKLFKAAREALDEAGLESTLICGTYVSPLWAWAV